ncbi:MAG: YqhA family protein [Parvibaculaceae bacterium]
MLKMLLKVSRYLVLAAVLGSLVAATALLMYGLVDSVVVTLRTLSAGTISTTGAKDLMFYFIELFDLFLLGTVMLIMALSLYELFIDSDIKVPARLQIHTFEDLKANLVTVVIAVMAVTFLGQVMTWDGKTDLLGLGVAVALVIAALNIYLWIAKVSKK